MFSDYYVSFQNKLQHEEKNMKEKMKGKFSNIRFIDLPNLCWTKTQIVSRIIYHLTIRSFVNDK